MTDLGVLERKTTELLSMPLSDQEEAILSLLRKVHRLEGENLELRETIKRMSWSLEEHD